MENGLCGETIRKVVLGLIALVAVCSILFFDFGIAYAEDNSIEPKTIGAWQLYEHEDDFGDPTGELYFKTSSKGTYSNSDTIDSDLIAVTFTDPDISAFVIRLTDHNGHSVTIAPGADITIKFKVNGMIWTHIIAANNGQVAYGQGQIEINTWNERYSYGVDAYNQLLTWMEGGVDVRTIIYIGDSKYSFTISGDGFLELWNYYEDSKYGDSYKTALGMMEEGQYEEAIDILETLLGYKDSLDLIIQCQYETAIELKNSGDAKWKKNRTEIRF